VMSDGSGVRLVLLASLSSLTPLGCSDEFLVVLREGTVECHAESLVLEVGEWVTLPTAESICLVFAPTEARCGGQSFASSDGSGCACPFGHIP
jgi:hypothetical protein